MATTDMSLGLLALVVVLAVGIACSLDPAAVVRLNLWSPRTGPGFTSHDGSKFIKIYFQQIASLAFSPTAFLLPCRRGDNCRQSGNPGLPRSARPATSRSKIPTSREVGWRATPGPADRQGSGAIEAFPGEFHEDLL